MAFLNTINKELKVGLLATISLITLYTGSSFLKGHEVFSSGHVYHVIYSNSKGLGTASPVLINGIAVGKVKYLTILPKQNYSVLVTFETQQDIQLTSNTTATLVNASFLGLAGKAVELVIKEGEILPNGSTVPGKIAQDLGEILEEKVIPGLSAFQEPVIVAEELKTKLTQNIDKISSIFEDLEVTSRFLKQLVDTNSKSVDTVSQGLLEVSNALVDSENGIRPLLTALNEFTEGIEGQDIKKSTQKLNEVLTNLEQILDVTEGKDNLHCKINQTLTHLDELIVDIKKNPRRYVRFSIFGR